MALEQRTVPVLIRGLDQKQPKQTGVTGALDLIQNMILQKTADGGYEFIPRPGTTNVPKTADVGTISTGMRLATLGSALVLMTGTSCYRKAIDEWHIVDRTAPVIGVDTKTIGSGAIVAESSDYAYVNGFTVAALSYYDGKLWAVRVEVADSTGTTVFSTVADISAVSVIGSVKVAVSGSSAIVFWAQSNGNSVIAAKFDSTAPSSLGSPVTVTTADAGLLYDVQTVGATGKIVVGYSSGGAITQRLLTVSSMAVSAATTYAGLNTLVTFGYLTNDYSTNVIYIGTIAAAGLQVSTMDGGTLALGATTTYDAGQTVGFNLSGNRTGGTVNVFFTSAPHAPPGIPVCDYLIKTSSGGAATIVFRSIGLSSRVIPVTTPFGQTFYALGQQRGGTDAANATRSTYFLLDLTKGLTIGMVLKDEATTVFYKSGGNHLQNLRAGAASTTLLTAGLQVVSVTTDAGTFFPYIAGAAITFTLQDANVGRGVELDNGLHIPGAQPYLYDGLTLTEHGFPVGPDAAESLTPAGGGGMTSSVTYTYVYVDEWMDAAGNLWLSNPSTPQSVPMGAGTKVTHSIPALRLTRKTGVSLGVYRTLANGDGSVYFKVSSATAPTLNDPTVDRITFVDTVSDVVAAAGQPVYTTGGVLENIAVPACRTMAVHRGRLLAAGIAGDVDALWFSKNVVPGFGVEFSDFLVSRITSVQPITAVASLDSYAVACTTSQSWASINEYPDDTGAGGVLVFQQQSDTTGCATVGLLGRNDLGLMTYGGADKGIWRSSRGMSWDYVGSQVEDDLTADVAPVAIVSVPGLNQMRVVTHSKAYVYESVYGQWQIWKYPTIPASFVDAVMWNGSPAYLCSDGTVVLESSIASGVLSDNGTMPQHTVTLSGINLFGVAGYGRLYITQVTGRTLGTNGFTLQARQFFDGTSLQDGTGIDVKSIDYIGTETELNFEVDPGTMGKSSRYNLTLSDIANGTDSAFTIAAITLLVGVKQGLSKLPPSRRAISSVPSGTGSLVWEYTTGNFLPSDNLDAESCYVVGGLVGSTLYRNGQTINVGFTNAGGQPVVGQTVWLASSQDDFNTARGKATATAPTTAMPVYPLFTQNIVPVGICTDNSRYATDRTCQVRLAVPAAPTYTVPSDQTFSLHRPTGFTVANNFSFHDTNAATSERNWQNGESIVCWFTLDTVAGGPANAYVISYYSGTRLWGINGSGAIVVYGDVINPPLNLGQPIPGLNVIALTKTGGNIRASLNGGTVGVNVYANEVTGAADLVVGGIVGIDGWTRGSVTGFTKLNRVLSDGELRSNSTPFNKTPRNYFAPEPTIAADANCQWNLDLTSWIGGPPSATAGTAGTGFAFTLNGAPTATPFSYTWNRNLRDLFLDGPLPSYDSKYLPRDHQLQRIAYTVNNLFDLSLLVMGFSLDDTDNGDEGAGAVFVSSIATPSDRKPLSVFSANFDGITGYSPFVNNIDGSYGGALTILATFTAPYRVELLVSDKLTRIDTFDSGGSIASVVYPAGATFDTATTAKRLVVLGDGQTYGGHSQNLLGGSAGSGAVVSRLRVDYPGRVSAFGCQATRSIAQAKSWGNGSMQPYADFVVVAATEGSPSSIVYLVALGFSDWYQAQSTVAQFAIDAAAFVDRLHAQDPASAIAYARPVQSLVYANTNANGETLQQFVNAVSALSTGRPWLTILDLTVPNVITFDGISSILPTASAGQLALKANIKAAAVVGYT